MFRLRVPAVAWTVMSASGMATLGTLPVFLLGAQSVFVRQDLEFGASQFGVAVSVFFASAAATALLGGGVADRLGRRYSTILAGLAASAGGFGVAFVAQSWASLIMFMAVLGVANAACQVTANLTLARVVPPHRRGLGFGVKQAAIPLAIMLAGLAVPTFAAASGWRWTFAITGSAGAVAVVVGFFLTGRGVALGRNANRRDRPPLPPLIVTMVAITVASAAANSLAAFIASWGFRVGLTPSQAGLLMAVGSAMNIVARIVIGHRADRRHGRNLPPVAAQMLVAAVSLTVLSVPSTFTVVPAVLVAFSLGWSWPGLLLFAVVRVGRESPGTASGIVQAGAFAGGAAGPAVFGLVVSWVGYEAAWRLAALLFVVAAGLVTLARRMFIADLVARPPLRPLGYGGGRTAAARTTTTSTSSSEQTAEEGRA